MALKRTKEGKVDKRTKEGKAVVERMAKARAARGKNNSFAQRLASFASRLFS